MRSGEEQDKWNYQSCATQLGKERLIIGGGVTHQGVTQMTASVASKRIVLNCSARAVTGLFGHLCMQVYAYISVYIELSICCTV